jgi:AcrR family transcriptional regulator
MPKDDDARALPRRPSHPRPRPLRSRRHLEPPSGADSHDESARARQKAERREALLDAAAEVIRKRGANASMEELAAAAGVSKPILYRHFGDRSGLVLALTDRFASGLMSELQAVLTKPADNPRDILVGAIDTFLRFIEQDHEIYRFLVQRAHGTEPETAIKLSGFLRTVSQAVAVVLGEQLQAAGQDAGGAEPLAHGIVAFVYEAGDWWTERRSMSRARLVEYLATALWSGFEGMGLGGSQNEQKEDS